MFDFSPVQIFIVMAILLLVFGTHRLPQVGRSLGRGMRELRTAVAGEADDDAKDTNPA
jgi:sec-independent protein translocase protein TatA